MCAILQLVSAPLNPIPTAEHFRRSHPQCEHSYGQHTHTYIYLYNNKINARVLIGQSAMVYCAGKPMEKSRVF